MATHTREPHTKHLWFHRAGILAGTLVGIAILLVTHDRHGVVPYLFLVVAACVAVIDYRRRTRPRRSWKPTGA